MGRQPRGGRTIIRAGVELETMSVSEGISSSEGDPRVVFVINAVLSAAFVGFVLSLASVADLVAFTWTRFAVLTVALMIVTYVVTH